MYLGWGSLITLKLVWIGYDRLLRNTQFVTFRFFVCPFLHLLRQHFIFGGQVEPYYFSMFKKRCCQFFCSPYLFTCQTFLPRIFFSFRNFLGLRFLILISRHVARILHNGESPGVERSRWLVAACLGWKMGLFLVRFHLQIVMLFMRWLNSG